MSYPSTISAFTNPSASNKLNSPSHSAIETAQNNELIQIENVIGTDSSVLGTIIGDLRNTTSSGGGHIQSANKGGTGQTSYTKGDLLIATSASVLSKLAVGADGLILSADSTTQAGIKWAVSPSAGTAQTILPWPVEGPVPINTQAQAAGSITASFGLINIPFQISVNKLTIETVDIGSTTFGLINVGLYPEAGGSSVLLARPSITQQGNFEVTARVSSIAIAAGNYWVGTSAANGSVITGIRAYNKATNDALGSSSAVGSYTTRGTFTISGGQLPSILSVASIVSSDLGPIRIRLDT